VVVSFVSQFARKRALKLLRRSIAPLPVEGLKDVFSLQMSPRTCVERILYYVSVMKSVKQYNLGDFSVGITDGSDL
jgi:hypothetical protein